MFSTVENEYLKAVINTYFEKGYKSYVCHTVTENNNEYDICIYFSKEDIEALNDNYFYIKSGLVVYIDTSTKSNYSVGQRDRVDTFSGHVTVDVAEFIYTNAKSEYSYNGIVLNPDIMIDNRVSKVDVVLLFVVCIWFMYMFISELLNGRR